MLFRSSFVRPVPFVAFSVTIHGGGWLAGRVCIYQGVAAFFLAAAADTAIPACFAACAGLNRQHPGARGAIAGATLAAILAPSPTPHQG